MLNEYVVDSKKYFHRCTPLISTRMSDVDTIDAILFYAVAVEKVLKGILLNVNPVYILEAQDFCNTAPILYGEKLLSKDSFGKEISKSPNRDVITYRKSLLRAKEFSPTTNQNCTSLHKLSDYRDTVLHRPTSEINCKDAAQFLIETYPLITEGYAKEFGVAVEEFVGDKIHLFDAFGRQAHKISVEKIIEKIGLYNRKWNRTKNDPGRKEEIAKVNNYVQEYGGHGVDCPACGNLAEVDYEPDYDYADGQSYMCGVFPVSVKCAFCGLELFEPSELDYLRMQGKLKAF